MSRKTSGRRPEKIAPLGEILLLRGLITREQFADGIHQQKLTGSRLGDILVADGVLGYKELYEAIADHYQLPFVNLLAAPPPPGLCNVNDLDLYLKLGFLPCNRNGSETIIACCEISEALLRWAHSRYGEAYALAVTSPLDIRRTAEAIFGATLEETSRMKLWLTSPEHSARTTVEPTQGVTATTLITLSLLAFWFAPHATALAFLLVCHVLFAASMLFKWWVMLRGAPMFARIRDRARATQLPPDDRLPVYTILLPVYREAGSLRGLFASLDRLDYPKSRLDIKLIVEADDAETYDTAVALKPHYHYEIVRVPYSLPKTKPKACNYALRFARGDYVCIYDADDHPSRHQLKRAVATFRNADEKTVCLQARLNYYNADENWLTRLFTLEYSILFDYTLPGLQSLGMPIPLGGTSNHIALHKLRELGEWDPYNVTEDADIGIRLARAGYRTEIMHSHTLEEAPLHLGAWMRQRTRWIKGYMQTWLVHMRRPLHLYRRLGWRGFLGFQMFVGVACFTFLSAPLLWGLSILWLIEGMPFDVDFVAIIYLLAWFNLGLQFGVHWHMARLAARRHRRSLRRKLWRAVLCYPLYPVLHTLASYRALWHLFVKPHLWEKTTHGVSRAQR